MKGYYYSKLNNNEQRYYINILETISSGETAVKACSFMNIETASKVVFAVNYDHPELFYVDFKNLKFIETLLGITYQICYIVKPHIRVKVINEINKNIDDIIDLANKENLNGDFEKCRWIHNYLVRNVRYNDNAVREPDNYPDSFGICGVFRDKLAVCEGISKAFKLLCDRLGVDALIVFGTASSEILGAGLSHTWNMVCIDGQFCHIDVTWDINMSVASKMVRYDYFCIPDRWLKKDHIYSSYPECTTDLFSYFRKRNRLFLNSKHLNEYLKSELKNKVSVLYFRVDNNNCDNKKMVSLVQNQVIKMIDYYNSTYFIDMMHNEKQMCFTFKISQEKY